MRWLWIAILVASGGAGAGRVAAQTPEAERALARRLMQEGIEAAREERWEDARSRFERSYELVSEPRILVNLATAQAHTGRLVEAADSYRRFLAAPEEAAELRQQVEREARAIEARIPTLRIEVSRLAEGDRVLLDDVEVARTAVGVALPVNPGEHRVVVQRGDTVVARGEVTAEEGEAAELALEVAGPASDVRAAAGARRDPDAEAERSLLTTQEQTSNDSGISAWVLVTVAALLLAGGVVAAILLVSADSETRQLGAPEVDF